MFPHLELTTTSNVLKDCRFSNRTILLRINAGAFVNFFIYLGGGVYYKISVFTSLDLSWKGAHTENLLPYMHRYSQISNISNTTTVIDFCNYNQIFWSLDK